MTDSVWCAGCNRYFADSKAFDLHAGGSRAPTAKPARRCRTVVEMHALGLRQLRGTSTWYLPPKSPAKSKP